MKKLTTEEFKNKLFFVNPNVIMLENYINFKTKILVKDENEFQYLMFPSQLLNGVIPNIQSATDKTKVFINKANKIHNFKYNYSLVNYPKTNKKQIIIICPIHGKFKQTVNDHLRGFGCPTCGINKVKKCRILSTKEFIKRANKIHNNKYNYSQVIYKNTLEKVNIICPKHGVFSQKPSRHIQGHGCPKCIKYKGWRRSDWINMSNSKSTSNPKVYIVRCYDNSESFIKIGITTNSIRRRLYKIPYSYEVIKEVKGSADFVWDKELELHKKFKKFKYKPSILFGGKSECFTLDILDDEFFN